jgi:MFS family permease
VFGYGLATMTKPIFPMATTIGWVFAARFIDRVGKGIRGAPRDALVSEIAPREFRGAAYGLRQSLDSIGALIGPIVAVAFMIYFKDDIRSVLWVAVIPAIISVTLLVFGVRDPGRPEVSSGPRSPITFQDIKQLPPPYSRVVLLGAVFTLARFSEAFLVLRAQDVGLSLGFVPLVLIIMNFFYTSAAYPAGFAADRYSQRALLIIGIVMLIAADLVLATAASPFFALLGAAFWGIHMGLSQGLFAKLVADTTPSELRGTAFGIFNLVSGGALLMASVVAGVLWSAFGASLTFLTGGAFSILALFGLLAYRNKDHHTQA